MGDDANDVGVVARIAFFSVSFSRSNAMSFYDALAPLRISFVCPRRSLAFVFVALQWLIRT